MSFQHNKSPIVVFALAITLSFTSPSPGADSTAFNPRTVAIVPKTISGVPVGTVVSWPAASLPTGDEAGKWLECDGSAITESAYPELYAVIGPTMPNYQGVFLRGYGSRTSTHYGAVTHSSGAIGQLQGDAIRNITGYMGATQVRGNDRWSQVTGPFARTGTQDTMDLAGDAQFDHVHFDASRVVPVANENRPVNVAVKYLIRAKP